MRARALCGDTKGIKLLLIRGDVTRIRAARYQSPVARAGEKQKKCERKREKRKRE